MGAQGLVDKVHIGVTWTATKAPQVGGVLARAAQGRYHRAASGSFVCDRCSKTPEGDDFRLTDRMQGLLQD